MTRKKMTNIGVRNLSFMCWISAIVYLLLFVALVTNITGFTDRVINVLVGYMNYTPTEADSQITMLGIECVIFILFAVYCARYYRILSIMVRDERILGKKIIIMAIFQLLFGMYLTGVVALIIGIVKSNKKTPQHTTVNESGIPNQKLELMGQAVERLKKLREIGAISEEEYYINLNKILEG